MRIRQNRCDRARRPKLGKLGSFHRRRCRQSFRWQLPDRSPKATRRPQDHASLLREDHPSARPETSKRRDIGHPPAPRSIHSTSDKVAQDRMRTTISTRQTTRRNLAPHRIPAAPTIPVRLLTPIGTFRPVQVHDRFIMSLEYLPGRRR
jgi:hypothetical protein